MIGELFAKYQFRAKHTSNISARKVTIRAVCSTDSELFRKMPDADYAASRQDNVYILILFHTCAAA